MIGAEKWIVADYDNYCEEIFDFWLQN